MNPREFNAAVSAGARSMMERDALILKTKRDLIQRLIAEAEASADYSISVADLRSNWWII